MSTPCQPPPFASSPKVWYNIPILILQQNGGTFMENNKKMVGEGVKFERIRRITGYLVGTVERFNDGKRAEEHDRVKHTFLSKEEEHKA